MIQANHKKDMKETIIAAGQYQWTKDTEVSFKAVRVATGVVVVAYDMENALGGMVHMALPDSKMLHSTNSSPSSFVYVALPQFLASMIRNGLSKATSSIKIIGGSQLFNFGGGSGNILNIGTRNAITARTMLSKEGFQVEKTETGGNKPRTVILEMNTGYVQVFYPGETPRYI